MTIEQRLAEIIQAVCADALSSAVNLNVDLDVVLCVLAQALTAAVRLWIPGNYANAAPTPSSDASSTPPGKSSPLPSVEWFCQQDARYEGCDPHDNHQQFPSAPARICFATKEASDQRRMGRLAIWKDLRQYCAVYWEGDHPNCGRRSRGYRPSRHGGTGGI